MTDDQLESPDLDLIVPVPLRPRRGRFLIAVALVAVAVVAFVLVVRAHGSTAPKPTPTRSSTAASADAAARLSAIRGLLHERSEAVLSHDRAQFMASVDPDGGAFRRSEAQMFHNLARVRFSSWSYSVSATAAHLGTLRQDHYDAPTWVPKGFALHYRIKGFDTAATDLPQYPTFVERSGRWYLASLSDFAGRGKVSSTDLWDYAPVRVVHRHRVLVLGPQSELPTMAAVGDQLAAAIPRVTSVWGRDWSRSVVALVPSSQHEMALIDDDHEDLDQIAALTSAEVSSTRGRPLPVGDRVTVNPRNWSRLDTLGAQIVLTHELTHVATRADTGSQTPKWLSEGFADYVGFLDSGLPPVVAASELDERVRAGEVPSRLPRNRDFRGSNPQLGDAYEEAWLACRYIAAHYGQPTLVRFYRTVGTSSRPSSAAVSQAMRHLLGVTPREFTRRWRSYIVSQLG